MGYYTRYTLEVDSCPDELYEIFENDYYGLKSAYFEKFRETLKWYRHEEEMKELSNKFPDILFTLSGEGEDQGDLWRKYFKNGKMQKVDGIISYENFDEGKLK